MSSEIKSIDQDFKSRAGHLPAMLSELESVKDNPRIVLVLACAFLEDLVGTLCEAKLKNHKEFKRLSLSQKTAILAEVGHIHTDRAISIDWVRGIRNKVAHSAIYKIENSHMPSWADSEHKSADKTFSLCVLIIGCFWNENVDVFKEKYLSEE